MFASVRYLQVRLHTFSYVYIRLLMHVASPTQQDGMTVLMSATWAARNRPAMVTALLSAGARVSDGDRVRPLAPRDKRALRALRALFGYVRLCFFAVMLGYASPHLCSVLLRPAPSCTTAAPTAASAPHVMLRMHVLAARPTTASRGGSAEVRRLSHAASRRGRRC